MMILRNGPFTAGICTLMVAVVVGCCHCPKVNGPRVRSNISTPAQLKAAGIANETGNKLYEKYLVSGTNEVGTVLSEIIQTGKEANFTESQRANWLFMTYSRFYAFEKRRGDPKLADAYFKDACYWLRRTYELAGGVSKEDTDAALARYTPESCVQWVDNWDKAHSADGKFAYYLRQ